ncbi:unnamed protein product [Linum trigynum]|uniref:Secreted protein n=1 Tax=Linum trigynum TaxID=586398 RepID=A0AAV2DGH4_9ROSI
MSSRLSATSASLFHVISRCSSTSCALDSFSSYCLWHSSNNSASISRNIFRTLTVNPWTAWFQCVWMFFSNASKRIGSTTPRFCAISPTMCSLFHKNSALSATWRKQISALCIEHFDFRRYKVNHHHKEQPREEISGIDKRRPPTEWHEPELY